MGIFSKMAGVAKHLQKDSQPISIGNCPLLSITSFNYQTIAELAAESGHSHIVAAGLCHGSNNILRVGCQNSLKTLKTGW